MTDLSLWQPICASAADVAAGRRGRPSSATQFDWLEVGDGTAFATGYYEPEIAGVRVRQPGYDVPVFATPTSLMRCTRADGTTGRGRIDPTGQCVAYFTRAEIEDGALAAERPIAWVADPIDLFFLQVQGSGRLRAPDGVDRADRLCRAEWPQLCRDRAVAARAQCCFHRAVRRWPGSSAGCAPSPTAARR